MNSTSSGKDNDNNTSMIPNTATADPTTTKSKRIPRADAAAGTKQLEMSSQLKVGTAATGSVLLEGGREEPHQHGDGVMETAATNMDDASASPVVQQTAEV